MNSIFWYKIERCDIYFIIGIDQSCPFYLGKFGTLVWIFFLGAHAIFFILFYFTIT